jgi:DNA-binding CsgD family transcriptional regulator
MTATQLVPVPGSDGELLGREPERAAIAAVLSAARAGSGAALVLAGNAGAGKSALLRLAAGEAGKMLVRWLPGAGPGGLRQVLAPLLSVPAALPAPQRAALGADDPAPLPAGLAVLRLLATASQGRPLLCLVDDADQLAPAAQAALAVAARRVTAAPVALLFAVRAHEQPFDDLPWLRVGDLSSSSAERLLGRLTAGALDPWTCGRLAAAAGGNPLALTDLATRYTTAELGRIAVSPAPGPVSGGLRAHFGAKALDLPADTRALLLALAAAPGQDVSAAGPALGFGTDSERPALRAGLLDGWPQPQFTHPLTRSAVYFGAPLWQRRRVHAILADLPGPAGRRAWHRAAHALPGPDAKLAQELAETAEAVANPAERCLLQVLAGELSADPGTGAARSAAGGQAALIAGASSYAEALAAQAEACLPRGSAARARAAATRAQARGELGRPSRRPAAAWLLEAARAELAGSPAASRESTLSALSQALLVRDGTCGVTPAALAGQIAAVTAADGAPGDLGSLLLAGFGRLIAGDYGAAAGPLRQALAAAAGPAALNRGIPGWFPLVTVAALVLWDDAAAAAWLRRVGQQARVQGALLQEERALAVLQHLEAASGRLAEAIARAGEIAAISAADGVRAGAPSPLVPAWQGDRSAVRATSEQAASGELSLSAAASHGLARIAPVVAALGDGRFPAALREANDIRARDALNLEQEVLPYLVEAAAACGQPEQAQAALAALRCRAAGAGTDWARGQLRCAEGILADGEAADAAFGAAIEALRRARRPAEIARAHLLYGEALVRQGRAADGGTQLRAAIDQFGGIGAAAYASRARRALRGTGERPASREPSAGERLTDQELAIARLAAAGATNRDIGRQLFIGASTVDYHLRKVYRKLGVSSRRALGRAVAELRPALMTAQAASSRPERTMRRDRFAAAVPAVASGLSEGPQAP